MKLSRPMLARTGWAIAVALFAAYLIFCIAAYYIAAWRPW